LTGLREVGVMGRKPKKEATPACIISSPSKNVWKKGKRSHNRGDLSEKGHLAKRWGGEKKSGKLKGKTEESPVNSGREGLKKWSRQKGSRGKERANLERNKNQ